MWININLTTAFPQLTFKFCNQNFRFSLPACCSNCEAPCCKASARSSSSESLASRSSTFSTFVRIMSTTWMKEEQQVNQVEHMYICICLYCIWRERGREYGMLTSSTWACVCCKRFCAAICWGLRGPPTISPSPPSPAGGPSTGGASPAAAASALQRYKPHH